MASSSALVTKAMLIYYDGKIKGWTHAQISDKISALGGVSLDGYTKSESDARYAQKSEIPTELPANGGNADTVGGHTVMTDVPENAVFTDTVIKSTVVSGTTDANSNLAVFPAADNKILIIGFYYNCICIPIVQSDGLLCMHMTAIDGTNMANTTIPSMEVFYFER